MEEVMPMEIVQNNFKAKVLRLKSFFKRELVCFYEALTSYGKMTLIVEEFFSPSSSSQHESRNQRGLDYKAIETRNKLLKCQDLLGPLIYEQEIKKVRENYFICLSLTEPIVLSKKAELLLSNEITKYQNLVECAFKMHSTQFQYEPDSYQLETYITSTYTHRAFFDFTSIQKTTTKHQETELQPNSLFLTFKKALCDLIGAPRPGKFSEVVFIKERPVVLDGEGVGKAKNWVDLALMFNLLQNEKVVVLSDKKVKTAPISRLQGLTSIEFKGEKYENLSFQEGYRMDAFMELGYEQLKNQFFQDKITYFMTKGRYQSVRKRYNTEEGWLRYDIEFTDLIIVKSSISKAEFISFLIGYFRYCEPIITAVRYIWEENALQLDFVSRSKKNKSLLLKFSSKYVVRDEEVCMIIEKGRLKSTTVDLRKMPITDSCLMYLANSDKMLSITNLDISYCPHLSDSGVQLLFASPLCKQLRTLKMSGLICPDFTVVKFKSQLLELQINDCQHFGEEFGVGDWKLQKLQALGVRVSLTLPMTLKHLSIDQEVMVEHLKYLRNLSLTHLKIRLVENKKNISTFFSALTMKDNPARLFYEGNSRKTLKHLDISHCGVKLREIKSLFMIETLETLICEGVEGDKFGDFTLPQNIVEVSLRGSGVGMEQASELLCRTSILIRLNVCSTLIDELSLSDLIRSKKYINDLLVSEEQFGWAMLQKRNGVETLHLHLSKLIRDEHELLLNKILSTQAETGKELNFVCDPKVEQKLIAKINRFTMFYQSHLTQMLTTNLNIFVNSTPLWKLITYHFQQPHQEHINILSEHSHYHKIRVQPAQVLAQGALVSQSIHLETLNVWLHSCLGMYRYPLVEVCLRGNRVLGKEVVGMIQQYAGNVLKAIDFRECLFGFGEVREELFEFPLLECVNEGEYEIELGEEDACEVELQKILKFFLKLTLHEKIKLAIRAHSVSERELFFSIMYEILHQYKDQIINLSIDFRNVGVEKSEVFWMEVFSLSRLEVFKLAYFNDSFTAEEAGELAEQFKLITNFRLYSLDVSTNVPNLLAQNLAILELKRLILDIPGQMLPEPTLMKLLKNVTTVRHLELRMSNNEGLSSLKRMSDVVERMGELSYLGLDIDNCSAKQNSVFEFIYCLQRNKHLERLELNINNIYVSVPDLVKFCELLQKQNRFLHILIYSTLPKKQSFTRDQNQLLAKGIEVVHGPSLSSKLE